MELPALKRIIEATLLVADRPLSIEQLERVITGGEGHYSRDAIREALDMLAADCGDRGIELKQVASGYRFQIRQELAPWVSRLWEERAPRYSRALLETLALVAYRQPITRAEIEEIRGVGLSSSIMRTLQEREWIRVVGHRDLPGRPAMYGTTRQFLDYFNLKSLGELPTLAQLADLELTEPTAGVTSTSQEDDSSSGEGADFTPLVSGAGRR
jgi:segregation and condensation protein B